MKKALQLLALLSITSISTFGQITNSAPYCHPTYDNNYNMISSMKVKGTSFSLGAMGSFGNFNTYLFYPTGVVSFPTLYRNDTSRIEIDFYEPSDMEPVYFGVWIDYNHNSTFDPAELVMQNSNTTMAALPTFGSAIFPVTKVITVPANAITGNTRMRIMRGDNNGNPVYVPGFSLGSCPVSTGNSYGCTYDFYVNIQNGTTGIEENMQEAGLFVFPNPAANQLTIISNSNLHISDVAVRNQIGQLVFRDKSLVNNVIDISEFPIGIYFVSVLTQEGKISNIKFVKE